MIRELKTHEKREVNSTWLETRRYGDK